MTEKEVFLAFSPSCSSGVRWSLGTISTSWPTITLPNGQTFTQQKQKGAQLAFASGSQPPVAAIHYQKDKHQKGKPDSYTVSIDNQGGQELAPLRLTEDGLLRSSQGQHLATPLLHQSTT